MQICKLLIEKSKTKVTLNANALHSQKCKVQTEKCRVQTTRKQHLPQQTATPYQLPITNRISGAKITLQMDVAMWLILPPHFKAVSLLQTSLQKFAVLALVVGTNSKQL